MGRGAKHVCFGQVKIRRVSSDHHLLAKSDWILVVRIICNQCGRGFSLRLFFSLQLLGSLSGAKDCLLANMDWCKGIVRRTMLMAPPRRGDLFGLPFRAYLIWRVGL